MFLKGLLLLLAASFLSAGRLLPQPETRIFGGKDTNIESAPWQVSLRFNGVHFCGGSIYSETIIITAAHCFYDKNQTRLGVENLTVLAGSANQLSEETIVKVAAFEPHKDYSPLLKPNDIGILKLSAPLNLTTKKMQKIALANEDPAPGTSAQVTGWGTALKNMLNNPEFQHTYIPTYLQAIKIQIQKLDYCTEMYGEVPKTICAGTAGHTTCLGDSGGPLVVNEKLAGVVSNGGPYCTSLTVYTSVYEHRKWIRNETKFI